MPDVVVERQIARALEPAPLVALQLQCSDQSEYLLHTTYPYKVIVRIAEGVSQKWRADEVVMERQRERARKVQSETPFIDPAVEEAEREGRIEQRRRETERAEAEAIARKAREKQERRKFWDGEVALMPVEECRYWLTTTSPRRAEASMREAILAIHPELHEACR